MTKFFITLYSLILIFTIWIIFVPTSNFFTDQNSLEKINFCINNKSDENFNSLCDFKRANLRNINLEKTDLSGFDFSGADLTGANLSFTKLNNAIFYGANLREANLYGADLQHSKMDGSYMRDTILENTNFHNMDNFCTNIKFLHRSKFFGENKFLY